MLTLFTVPKPFRGDVGDIQRNAIESWRALHPEIQVVLVGDEEGVAQTARDLGVEHVGDLARNERGTPRLDSAFERVGTVARLPLWCMVNADVVLLDDFLSAVRRVTSRFERFLVVGECRDLPLAAGTRLANPDDRLRLRERALAEGRLRGYAALDYFVFPRGQFGTLPPFLIGRACFDNWLVWRVRQLRDPVIDATRSIVAVHQTHDYAHVAGGKDEAYHGEEARYNERLAGGRSHIYTLHDASHRLYGRGAPLRYPGSILRAREGARAAGERVRVRVQTRRASTGVDSIAVLGVFPAPTPEWAPTLDALAASEGVDVTVLYGARSGAGPELHHAHWFPRAIRLPVVERLLGREYPVNWAIWNSFRGLRPDCMLIAGWGTFAGQAAILWSLMRATPYLLVLGDAEQDEPAQRMPFGRVLVAAIARRAAGFIVLSPASPSGTVLRAARQEGVRHLAGTTDLAAAQLSELVRSAVADRPKTDRKQLLRAVHRSFRG